MTSIILIARNGRLIVVQYDLSSLINFMANRCEGDKSLDQLIYVFVSYYRRNELWVTIRIHWYEPKLKQVLLAILCFRYGGTLKSKECYTSYST